MSAIGSHGAGELIRASNGRLVRKYPPKPAAAAKPQPEAFPARIKRIDQIGRY